MRGRLCSATLKDYENDNNSERVHEFWTSYFDYLIPLVKTRPDFQYIGIVCFKINVVNNEILAIEVKGSYRESWESRDDIEPRELLISDYEKQSLLVVRNAMYK